MYLIFDTETTGTPPKGTPFTDTEHMPRMVQIAWQLHDDEGRLIEHEDYLIKPDGFNIPFETQKVHGISTELATERGRDLAEVLDIFTQVLQKADYIVGHNLQFDIDIVSAELIRTGKDYELLRKKTVIDTMTEVTAEYCKLPGGRGGKYKYPRLGELYEILFDEKLENAHNATADVEANARVFFELVRLGVINETNSKLTPEFVARIKSHYTDTVPLFELKHEDLFELSKRVGETLLETEKEPVSKIKIDADTLFAHLHVYTQFSILQSTVKHKELIEKAAEYKMPAIAVTDKGNMFGAFRFWLAVDNYNKGKDENEKIKPILGVELNVCRDHTDKTRQDDGHPVVLLAKNKTGYQNLIKLVSIANLEGFYYVPRIDKALLKQYREGLIALSGGLEGEIPHHILRVGESQAESKLQEWLDIFGGDFYLEVMRHGLEEEEAVNKTLKRFSEKYGVKLIAANQVYYTNPEDFEAHEILLSVRDGKRLSDPVGKGRNFRKALPVNEYYFKSPAQMFELFETDMPEAILNIAEVLDKIEYINLSNEIIMPKFEVPDEFKQSDDPDDSKSQAAYLRHLVFEGAKKRWGEKLDDEIIERLEYELKIINESGFAGYFLIVWDVINKAREMGVMVGPGRGSAAGSAVAYTLGITNVDPIKYQLLFERFLNPDRVSMPDIDMDFDDVGRDKVINYVINKYGINNVAHIITYGVIKAKTAIRDAFRVMEIDFSLANELSKLADAPLDVILNNDKNTLKSLIHKREELDKVLKFKDIIENKPQLLEPLKKAATIEGAIRNRGIHACGFIIAPKKLDHVIPVTNAKDTNLLVTQFDNKVVEQAGLLKMDFLGVKTLSVIKNTVEIIKKRHGIEIDIDNIPLDDDETYRLFREGRTVGVFQFESAGMRKYLKELKPTEFEDLIAMVALFRPGPMDKIPSYIARKHGLEKVTYDLEVMEEYLKPTYGITIYQEQVMLLSQKIAGFTGGQADRLRKAMGKKKKKELDELKSHFIEGGIKNGHPKDVLEKIWKDWESFAHYAFNRSHAVSYAIVAYQTAWLKAHYPAEFLSASMSNHISSLEKVTKFIEDAKLHGIKVLPPDVNESEKDFTVNKEGNIRFGLVAIKGVGESAAEGIIKERQNGNYASIYDFVRRVNLGSVNSRVLEALAVSGSFDSFGFERDVFICNEKKFIEELIKYGHKYKNEQMQSHTSLFGGTGELELPEPKPPKCSEPLALSELLELEKEYIGFYISGHPLDMYKHHINFFKKHDVKYISRVLEALNNQRDVSFNGTQSDDRTDDIAYDPDTGEILENTDDSNGHEEVLTLKEAKRMIRNKLYLTGVIIEQRRITTKKGNSLAFYKLEDYTGELELGIFSDTYLKKEYLIKEGMKVGVVAMIEENFNRPGTYSARTIDVVPLENVLETYSKGIVIRFNEIDVDKQKIDLLTDIVSKHKGKKNFEVYIHSIADNFNLKLSSRKYKVDINTDLLDELEKAGFEYKVY
jgi:DNA polymerase-3 subunit alpha